MEFYLPKAIIHKRFEDKARYNVQKIKEFSSNRPPLPGCQSTYFQLEIIQHEQSTKGFTKRHATFKLEMRCEFHLLQRSDLIIGIGKRFGISQNMDRKEQQKRQLKLVFYHKVEAFEIVDESLKGAYDELSMGKALRLLPGTKWVFRNKLDENDVVSRNKALVAQGYNQLESIDYDDTIAPVATLESIGILIAYFDAIYLGLKSTFMRMAFVGDEDLISSCLCDYSFLYPQRSYHFKELRCSAQRLTHYHFKELRCSAQCLAQLRIFKSQVKSRDGASFLGSYHRVVSFCGHQYLPTEVIRGLFLIRFDQERIVKRVPTSSHRVLLLQSRAMQLYKLFQLAYDVHTCRMIHRLVIILEGDMCTSGIENALVVLICTFMRCCLTLWFSKIETTLVISTTKAEYVSAGKACQQALCMKEAFIDYDINLGDILIKLKPKADIGIFIGYFEDSKGFQIYNRRTRKIMETIHVKFDELTTMDSKRNSLEPDSNCINFQDPSAQPSRTPTKEDLDNMFGLMFNEYFEKRTLIMSTNFVAHDTIHNDDTPSSTIIIVDEDEAPHIVSITNE
uniref:Uncharacterized protein n=1 Tax=Tanacetum cinerariifolium TaxID=118510 RepID=A0A6L2KXE9_TANCI|nr:hypothetical protein [Tanacetum cinerariifolium]